jgi:hypothetical protein
MAVIMNEYGCSRAQSYRYVSDAMSVLAILWPIKRSWEVSLGEELIRSQQRSIKNKDEAAYLKAAALRIRWFW